MTIEEINKKLSHLNPYSEKEEIRELLIARRKLIKQQDKAAINPIKDAFKDVFSEFTP
jgi:hypothetical protein